MVIFYVYMRKRVKKSPFYVAYMQIGNLCIGNLCMQRKKLRKPSYPHMRILYGAKEITALVYNTVVRLCSCRKPLINVPYKRTFGAPDQGQTLDV